MQEQHKEFYLNVVVIAMVSTAFFMDKLSAEVWLGIIGGVAGVYTMGRSYLKANGNYNGEVKK